MNMVHINRMMLFISMLLSSINSNAQNSNKENFWKNTTGLKIEGGSERYALPT
jgi:hypothetical protein